MGTINRINPSALVQRKELTTKGELVQAAKAIHDQLVTTMSDRLGLAETEIGLRLGKVLDARLTKAMEVELVKALEVVQGRYEKRLELMEQSHRKSMEALAQQYDEKVGFLKAAYESGLERMESLVRSIQIPPPTVRVESPVVNVTVPDQPPASVNVTVPVPEVNVKAADVQAPNVVVNVPSRRTKKTITYDQYSRPESIISEDIIDSKDGDDSVT